MGDAALVARIGIVPKPFPAEFTHHVIAVASKGEASISQIARDFGISESRRVRCCLWARGTATRADSDTLVAGWWSSKDPEEACRARALGAS